MVNGTIVIMCLIGVVLAIALNYKFNLQMGVSAFVFAFIIGVIFMGMRVKEVIALFPTSIYFQVMCLSLFFGYGVVNGTMEAIANHMLYASKEKPWMIVFILTAIGYVLGALGCVPPAIGAILAVMAFNVAIPSGVDPRICVAIGGTGNASGFVVWGACGSIISSTIASVGYEAESHQFTWIACAVAVLVTFVAILIFFFGYKGYKIQKVVDMQKPAEFTREQKLTLIVILVMVFFAVVPGCCKTLGIGGSFMKSVANFCDMQVLCLIGFIVCKFLKLADQKKVIQACPWNTLLLLAGISCLMSVATKAGAVEILTNWLSANIPVALLPLFMVLLGGFLSCFSGGITVVFPMVAPMVPPLVAASGANPLVLFISVLLGAHFTGMSPFSTGGAVFMGSCHDEDMAKKLVTQQLVVCGVSIVLAGIVCTALGFVM